MILSKDILLQAPWIHLQSVNSTNRYLLDLAEDDICNGLTCSADTQTEGAGRGDRKWISPVGGLYMSILVRPDRPENQWQMLSFVMAVTVAKAIRQEFPDLEPGLKWPNDVLIQKRKVAGILLQCGRNAFPRVVIGVGVNVSIRPEHLPERLLFPACSVNQQSVYPASIKRFAKGIREAFFTEYSDWHASPDHIAARWESLSIMTDKHIVFDTGKETISGKMCGISQDGALKIKTKNQVKAFYSGDILSIGGYDS